MKRDDIKISDKDLWKIVDNLHDEIMVYDNDYNLVYVNQAAYRHYGMGPETIIGRKFSEVDDTYWGNSTLPEVYEKKTMVAKRQMTNLGLDIVTISVPIFDEDGQIKYVAQNVNDIYNYTQESQVEEGFLNIMTVNPTNTPDFISESRKMQDILELINKIRDVKSPVLINGETGSGKSHLAKYIHSISNRKEKPFVAVNCSCINPNLLESEFFGYEKGAFSGANTAGKKGIVELADGGTLFLDEITEIPLELQAKMLHFIQEQEFMPVGGEKVKHVDVRIIAATNRSIKKMVASDSFREDLYYRLNTFEVTIPPLRERRDDTKKLIEYNLKCLNEQHLRHHTISDDAMNVLIKYSWPGNIRELSHVIEKIYLLTDNQEIDVSDLPKSLYDLSVDIDTDNALEEGMTLGAILEEVERQTVTEAYNKYGSSIKVGKVLSVSQPTAYRLIKKHCKK